MKFTKPHIYFWITAIIIFIAGLFTFSDKNALIDINVYDTYFIIHLFHLISLISLLYLIEGSIYWVLKKLNVCLINCLTKIHLFFTVGGLLVYFLLMIIFEDDTEVEPGVFNESSILGWVITVIICTILFSQILFILNIIFSTVKHFISNSKS
ncbi:hypothetical protein L3X37_12315 [Sabulilitoribacter arenilitoris]|uniref:Uncharacterized protein n=1 Tax=Wocania arenilitoris TaxID=2044858 RepID=A0AAE3EP99_9FLAO|nr:hypothetical protein [Wocania arenilitoris]MCF7569143.1 hypothetical protein [Wocania arenilitoris]